MFVLDVNFDQARQPSDSLVINSLGMLNNPAAVSTSADHTTKYSDHRGKLAMFTSHDRNIATNIDLTIACVQGLEFDYIKSSAGQGTAPIMLSCPECMHLRVQRRRLVSRRFGRVFSLLNTAS